MVGRKVWREIKQEKGQFLTIFLMVFMAMFIYTGIYTYVEGMSVAGEKYFMENNLPDATIEAPVVEEFDIKKIKEVEKVVEAERVAIMDGKAVSKDGIDLTVRMHLIESNNLAKFFVVEGRGFGDQDGMWLDAKLAKKRGYQVGDRIKIRTDGKEFEKEIVGLVLSPDKVYDVESENQLFASHETYGFGYLNAKYFPFEKRFSKVMMSFKDDLGVEEVRTLKDELRELVANSVLIDKTETVSYKTFENEKKEGVAYVMLFSSLFMVIAVMTAVSTLARLVRKQRREIGIMRSIGFKDRKIKMIYVRYGLFVAVPAVLLAIVIAPLTISQVFLNLLATTYAIPNMQAVVPSNVYIGAVMIAALMGLVGYSICRKELKLPSVELLKGEIANNRKEIKSEVRFEKLSRKIPFSLKWNFRDIRQNKLRALAGVAGICGAVVLALCGMSLVDTMNNYLSWQFDKLTHYDYKVKIDKKVAKDKLDETIETLKNKYNSGTSMNFLSDIEGGDKFSKKVEIVVDDANGLLGYTGSNGETIGLEREDGVYVSVKLLGQMGGKVGDKIRWKSLGGEKWEESEIVGTIRKPQNQNIVMKRAYFERKQKYIASNIYVNRAGLEVSQEELGQMMGVESVQKTETMKDDFNKMMKVIFGMSKVTMMVAVILAIVIIYNIESIALVEKKAEFATLAVLGFRRKKIVRIFKQQNWLITIVGLIIGLPFSYVLIGKMFEMAMGVEYDFMMTIRSESFLQASVLVIVTTFVMGIAMGRKIIYNMTFGGKKYE